MTDKISSTAGGLTRVHQILLIEELERMCEILDATAKSSNQYNCSQSEREQAEAYLKKHRGLFYATNNALISAHTLLSEIKKSAV
tara:strand:+ start:18241 stop:18495 length:255 start_codon:yes stop_codon:yes gene_type:complete